MFKNRFKKMKKMRSEDMESKSNEPTKGYEGKEHVKYKAPGYTRHEVDYPEDEPHMKGRVGKDEMHEEEDDYHMENPHVSMELPKRIPRAHMAMEDEHKYNERTGNLVTTTGKPIRDGDGQEEYGPKMYQKDTMEGKEGRKKMIAAVLKRKMMKKKEM